MSLGGSVDRSPLLQTLANHQGLLARERDRALLSFGATMEQGEVRGKSTWGRRPSIYKGDKSNRYLPPARTQAVLPLLGAVLPLVR